MRGPWAGRVVAACVAGALSLAHLRAVPAETAGPCTVIAGPVEVPDLPEASGLAVSRRNPKVIWSHNDSGNAAVLFALDPDGRPLGHVDFPIATRDWEDVSAATCRSGPCLYIADIGDNRVTRAGVRIYRVPEPLPTDRRTARPEIFNATYEDGAHNAEAMFVVGVEMFIITRDRTGGVYRASPGAKSSELVFRRIGELGVAVVTDAEATPDEKSVVVRTYHEVLLYRTADLISGSRTPYARIPIDALNEPQGEGVALDANGMLYLASEGRPWNRAGRFFRLKCTLPSAPR